MPPKLDDPAGQGVEPVRIIRDEIRTRRAHPARRARRSAGDRGV